MAQQVQKCFSTQFIDANGKFDTNGVAKFEKDVKLAERGRSYGVVSIMGPQSSGKSTLLNHLFGCEFKEMDAQLGWFQTTKGIFLAQSPSTESCILVVDTEGSDGVERKDNTAFERKTALFVIAISDIVMINMWQHDIGRRNAASWPLLSVVFEVMLRLLTPRKVHLMFVLRDSLETLLEKLQMQLMQKLEEIWNEIAKPPAQVNTALHDRFKIEVVALASYKHQEKQFKEDVTGLRASIVSNSTSDEAASRRNIPASGFAEYAKTIWDEIKEDKDLDLPSYGIMVAEVRCNTISKEKYQHFCENESWLQIENDVKSGAEVQGFGKKVSSLIDTCLSLYDKEAQYYDETKRDEYKMQLIERILEVVKPTHFPLVERMRRAILQKFEEEAMDELKINGVLMVMNIHKFVNKFENQLTDAVIKQANWIQTTEQVSQLESEINRYIEWVARTNEILAQQKRDQREFWFRVAAIVGEILLGAVQVGAAVLLPPGLGTATFQSISIASTILAKALEPNNQEKFDPPFHAKSKEI